MKYLALVLALALGSCAIKPNGTSAIQQATVNICRFLPTAETVASIFLAGNPLVSTTSQIANAICNAVTTRPLADGPRHLRARVNGVEIEGKFIR